MSRNSVPHMKRASLMAGLCMAAAVVGTIAPTSTHAAPAAPALTFRIDEGRNINSFLRDGPVAAHLLLRSGHEPRVLVAFPAGNSGVGLWFEETDAPIEWQIVTPPKAVS